MSSNQLTMGTCNGRDYGIVAKRLDGIRANILSLLSVSETMLERLNAEIVFGNSPIIGNKNGFHSYLVEGAMSLFNKTGLSTD